jgi:broad specificity phosphatase PhoE
VSDSDAVVLLVRHGRTALNAAGVLRGRLDPPLDDVGEREARALAEAFQGSRFTTVVTSPLMRAYQTAMAIAESNGAALEVDPDLADRDYGSWAGSSVTEVVRQFGSLESAPGIEPEGAFISRVAAAVTAIADRSASIPVVVVAHDAVNRALLAYLVPAGQDPNGVPQHTGCWNRLERIGESWSAPVVGAVPPAPGEPHG